MIGVLGKNRQIGQKRREERGCARNKEKPNVIGVLSVNRKLGRRSLER